MEARARSWSVCWLVAGVVVAGSVYAAVLFYPLRALSYLSLGQP